MKVRPYEAKEGYHMSKTKNKNKAAQDLPKSEDASNILEDANDVDVVNDSANVSPFYEHGLIYHQTTANYYVNKSGMIMYKNENGLSGFIQKNKFSVGDSIEIMKPSGEILAVIVDKMYDEAGNEMESCPHPDMKVFIDVGAELDEYDLMRKSN